MRTVLYTMLALVAFAANSVLCRLALVAQAIDPATFSTIRFASGALALWLLTLSGREAGRERVSWLSVWMLFLYGIPFSFAYVRLTAGTGALIMFGSVQVTMMAAALGAGERLVLVQWMGLGAAIAGLVYLVSPGLTAPPLTSAALMAVAGFAWGVYSLRGRRAASPLHQTAANFLRVAPLALVVSLMTLPRLHVEPRGAWLAAASGVLASGLGYAVWYAALRRLTASRASALQLAVPMLAAVGGVLFLDEPLSARLVVSSVLIVGGIAIVLMKKGKGQRAKGRNEERR